MPPVSGSERPIATLLPVQLRERANDATAELSAAARELATRELALQDAENAAERAAEQLLSAQEAAAADVQEQKGEATARAVRLENELMNAEAKAGELQVRDGKNMARPLGAVSPLAAMPVIRPDTA